MLSGLQGIAAAAANAVIRGSLDCHVDLEGADGAHSLCASDGTLVSLFEWRGVRSMMDAGEMSLAAETLRGKLASWLDSPGHALQAVYSRDPLGAAEEARRATAPAEAVLRGRSMDLSDVIEGRRRKLAESGAAEQLVIALYTRPSAVAPAARRAAGREIAAGMKGLPPVRDAQVAVKTAAEVRQIHEALAEALPREFALAGQEIRLMTADEAASCAASFISPRSGGIKARLAGSAPDGRPVRAFAMPETRAALSGRDFSPLGVERLSWQLLRDHARLEKDGAVRIGDSVFRPFDIAVLPEILTPFGQLIASTASSGDPIRWRLSLLIESGGWAGTSFKRMYTIFCAFLNRTHNTRIRDAFARLEEMDGADETIVRLRACAACWDDAGQEERLLRSSARFRQALERWGNARADALAGDPVACLFGSVPGAGSAPTAPSAAAPLTDALALLPLDRPSSPWKSGPMPLTTEDGKLWPCRPGSEMQDSWCDLISGAPGSGKSALLNSMNAAAMLAGAGRDDPPPILGVIDIGSSSSGLADMVRGALPPEERGKAVSVRLRNSRDHAVNLFDAPLGCRRPTALGRAFLVNFVRLLLDDPSGGAALAGLIGHAVDQAYRTASDAGQPRRWSAGAVDGADRALTDCGWRPDEGSTWWEAVDFLSDAGRWEEASAAQRMASPLLSDLAAASAEPRIADIYRDMRLPTGEPALEGLRRALSEAAADWPLLSAPTRFRFAGAELRCVDLQDVTSRSSEPSARRASALMYMLARHVCTEGFYLSPDEVPELGLRRSQRERLLRTSAVSRRRPKRLSIDEFHRAGGLPGVVDQVETDVREGRKHNVQIALASQMLTDFGERLTGLASGVWICSASAPEIRLAEDALNLGSSAVYALRHRLTGPGPAGAPVFAAAAAKGGDVRQLLMHRLGGGEIWAYSTTAEDVALREELSARIGPAPARQTLAACWPGGSARSEIQRRAELAAERSRSGQTIAELADELARGWRESM